MNCIHTVPVQNNDGKPLSPTRPAKAKWLLKNQKAVVIELYPFTIRLTYQVENPVFQPTRLKQDDGKTCGFAVVQENHKHNRVLCTAEMKTRGEEISDNLKSRKTLRAEHRNRNNKKHNKKGQVKIYYRHGQEYPPSIRTDVQTKVNIAKHLIKMYPITEILLEPVKIDLVKQINPKVKGKDYQNGLAKGVKGPKNQKRRLAILKRDGYKCLYCGTSVTLLLKKPRTFIILFSAKRAEPKGTIFKEHYVKNATLPYLLPIWHYVLILKVILLNGPLADVCTAGIY